MEIKKHFCSMSEAIREGAKLRPQSFRNFFSFKGSCAIGAAAEACTGEKDIRGVTDILGAYPYIGNTHCFSPCVVTGCEDQNSLWGHIVHLNDDHKWTREAIADWLETEEEKLGYVLLTEENCDELLNADTKQPDFQKIGSRSKKGSNVGL